MPRLLLNWKKPKQGIQLCYGAYNQTKQHFEVPVCFWFQWMSLSNLFLMKFWKFLVLYLGCGCVVFKSLRWLKSLLPPPPSLPPSISMNKKLECKDHKYIPKCWERSVKRKSNLNFIRAIKNSSFDQHFLYFDILWSKPF